MPDVDYATKAEYQEEIRRLGAQVAMLERVVAAERALPTIYAASKSSLGVSENEKRVLVILRKLRKWRLVQKITRTVFRYIKSAIS